MEKVKTVEEINSAVKMGQAKIVTPIEPSVEVRIKSNTHKLPRFIAVTQNVEQTKIYKPMNVEEDVIDYADRRNKILNILLVISIVVLIVLIAIFIGISLQLLGVI